MGTVCICFVIGTIGCMIVEKLDKIARALTHKQKENTNVKK